MIYWHIQMNQPHGRGDFKIDSTEMLKLSQPVIATGEWDDIQCDYFTGKNPNGLKINDVVLVHEGKKPIALCKITSKSYKNKELTKKFYNSFFRDVKVLIWLNNLPHQFPQPQGTLERLINSSTQSWQYINDFFLQSIKENELMELSNLLKFKKQIILQGPPGTGKTRLAKELANAIVRGSDSENEIDMDQIQIVQFHPSYTYEDFVRGIVIQPNKTGGGLSYEPENKIFGNMIELAKINKIESKKDQQTLSKENWVSEQMEKFVVDVKSEIENSTRKPITGMVDIVGVEENAFRYKGKKGWSKLGNRMLIDDLVQAYLDDNTTRQDVKLNNNLSRLANWHATYYIKVLDDFRSFLNENELRFQNNAETVSFEKINPKNYVLIIDELNRANLSTVLGELIYALEYRNEKVSSIYSIEGNELQIPDNLYIIGTMNTADRSVSQIDYAIRRRFAFVEVLPKDLTIELDNDFKADLFKNVAELFVKSYNSNFDYSKTKQIERSEYLSDEFNPIDVWLGHSYFIQQYEKDLNGENDKTKPIDFSLRLNYEIKPILKEYVKDGILKQKAIDYIEDLIC